MIVDHINIKLSNKEEYIPHTQDKTKNFRATMIINLRRRGFLYLHQKD